eukprot:scaffold116667_cov18-Tisochrysis_lutea.AAC.1
MQCLGTVLITFRCAKERKKETTPTKNDAYLQERSPSGAGAVFGHVAHRVQETILTPKAACTKGRFIYGADAMFRHSAHHVQVCMLSFGDTFFAIVQTFVGGWGGVIVVISARQHVDAASKI